MISIFANEIDYNDARMYSAQIAYPVLLYFCILGVCKTIDYINAAMRVIFFIAVICGLYAVYYYVSYDTGRILEYYLSNDVTRLGELHTALSYGGSFAGADGIRVFRLTIPGLSSPNFGSLLVLPIIIGLCYFKNNNGIRRWLYGAASIFLFGCLVWSFSRGAVISLFMGVLFLAWKRLVDRKDIFVFLTISIIVAGVIGYGKVYNSVRHFRTRFAAVDLVNPVGRGKDPRVQVFYDALSIWAECPVMGCGTTNMMDRQKELFNSVIDHNYYSRILATRGMLGLIPFVLFLALLLIKVSSNNSDVLPSVRLAGNIVGAGMVAVIVNLHMFVPAELFHVWIWFAFTAAWIRSCSQLPATDQYRKKRSVMLSEARRGIGAAPA
jgi:hypothetical protein